MQKKLNFRTESLPGILFFALILFIQGLRNGKLQKKLETACFRVKN
jgi:hypothetical protein